MPTYATLKDVKKRWGRGQEDVFPVTQFEQPPFPRPRSGPTAVSGATRENKFLQ